MALGSHKKTAAETLLCVQPHSAQRKSAFVCQRRQILTTVFVSILHVDSFAFFEGHQRMEIAHRYGLIAFAFEVNIHASRCIVIDRFQIEAPQIELAPKLAIYASQLVQDKCSSHT